MGLHVSLGEGGFGAFREVLVMGPHIKYIRDPRTEGPYDGPIVPNFEHVLASGLLTDA